VGFCINMPITRRGHSPSCFTQHLAMALRQRAKRVATTRSDREHLASCRKLRSVPEARVVTVAAAVSGIVSCAVTAVDAAAVRAAALSFLFVTGCSGQAGDLFPAMHSADESAVSGGGSGGSSVGAGASSSGGAGAAAAGGSGVTPAGVGASDGLGSAGSAAAGFTGMGAGSGGASGGSAAAGQAGVGSGGTRNSGGNPGGSAGTTAAGGSAPTCDPCPCGSGPFGEPERVLGLGVAVDSFGPAPSADGLTMFFSAVGADEDILFSTRASRANAFGPAVPVPGVNLPDSADGTPFLSFDGGSLYFFSDRLDAEAQGDRDLWVAQASGPGVGFDAPAVVGGVNGSGLEHLPRLSPDGLTLMFVSSRVTTSGGSNIFESQREDLDAPFNTPVELPGVNSDARDEGFWLSEDGLTVYFASNRLPEAAMDIWVAERPDRASPFGTAVNLEAVNTPGNELDPAITSDGFELFFASDRSGTMQLYRSVRQCQ
jgi:Tol biopolymer transport system component